MSTQNLYDTLIIGAGAAGMMCAAFAAKGGKRVLVLDHADKPGEKIRISGGGRCNFTNLQCSPDNFLSDNPRFCRSALARYTPQDFIDLVNRYDIDWHEKTKGQLFCDGRAQQIIDLLVTECESAGAEIWLGTNIEHIEKTEAGFCVTTPHQTLMARALVIACGGPSIPKMGATGYGYKVAESFGLNVITPTPALVPLTFTDHLKDPIKALSGMSVEVRIFHKNTQFDEALLFTHRGISGPAVLQISSYWSPGDDLSVNLAPHVTAFEALKSARLTHPRQSPEKWLTQYMPTRLAQFFAQNTPFTRLADMSDKALRNLALQINTWYIRPAGSEGFRTAEVTKGGVDTRALSSKTMEVKSVPGLYFIGEVVDVTGHLGGHNFQWAWASGHAAGTALS